MRGQVIEAAASNPHDGASGAVLTVQAPPPISPSVQVLTPAEPPTPDLWAELRGGFALAHYLDERRVQQEIRWVQRHPDYLERLAPALRRYLPYIAERVEARGMPMEIALLPIIESALDPYAFSPGGAAGLWQFIPVTAKRFGLERDYWYDGRRDLIAATEAALDYLTLLNRRFDDWLLALAGYNAGEGNVSKALRRARGERDFFELRLPRETRGYVPRLLAYAALVAAPEKFGIELPPVEPARGFQVVELPGQFDLMKISNTLDIELEELYRWNPALNQWATPVSGQYRLLLPAAIDNPAQRLLAIDPDQRMNFMRVTVNRGETLSHLAHRHKTDISSIRRANNLSSNVIRAGQAIFIPKSHDLGPAIPGRPAARSGTVHVVREGDSLWSIGKQHKVSVGNLVRWNRIGPKEVLRVGQKIHVARGGEATPGRVTRKVHYSVRRGDSLARIAGKFGVRLADIVSWNSLDPSRYLQPGQALTLYVTVAGR
jgi:membrane-bound lytic murein transglycosylase D